MDRVAEAFRAVPREGFLPRRDRSRADYDGPIAIGGGQTNSQPRTVEDMLRLLDPRPGDRVLDVGAGSGWTTALLAHLVGPTGEVVGVERVPELVDFGRRNLARAHAPQARIEPATEGVLGLPGLAPYDRILVSANARDYPDQLAEQLAEGGRMVVPVNGVMLRVEADGTITEHGYYRFVPLV